MFGILLFSRDFSIIFGQPLQLYVSIVPRDDQNYIIDTIYMTFFIDRLCFRLVSEDCPKIMRTFPDVFWTFRTSEDKRYVIDLLHL